MMRILLICMALASGGAAAWMVGSMGADATASGDLGSLPAEGRTQEVLVAAADVDQGAELTPDQVRWQSWPTDSMQSAFILRSEQPDAPERMAGSVARTLLLAGTPVFDQSVAPAKASLLSAVLARGKRAVAISISAEKTAGGFVLPNDRVDVLLTSPCRPQDGCKGSMGARTILRNVRVLAIDQSDGKEASDAALVGKTATLELEPLQAETITAAQASGTLSLVLRSASDHAETRESLAPKSRTVRVMRGGVSDYVTVR